MDLNEAYENLKAGGYIGKPSNAQMVDDIDRRLNFLYRQEGKHMSCFCDTWHALTEEWKALKARLEQVPEPSEVQDDRDYCKYLERHSVGPEGFLMMLVGLEAIEKAMEDDKTHKEDKDA